MVFPPNFKTKRLYLKAVTENDIPAYEKHFVDYEIIRHLASTVPWPYPENGVNHFVKETILPKQGMDHWVWGIFFQQSPDELIGVVDLWKKGTPEHRGFWLGKHFWGQGIMAEAVNPINKFAFTKLGFERLVFSNAKGNTQSRRVKEKTGAKFIGVRAASFVDPVYTEAEDWELTKTDWLQLHKSELLEQNNSNEKI